MAAGFVSVTVAGVCSCLVHHSLPNWYELYEQFISELCTAASCVTEDVSADLDNMGLMWAYQTQPEEDVYGYMLASPTGTTNNGIGGPAGAVSAVIDPYQQLAKEGYVGFILPSNADESFKFRKYVNFGTSVLQIINFPTDEYAPPTFKPYGGAVILVWLIQKAAGRSLSLVGMWQDEKTCIKQGLGAFRAEIPARLWKNSIEYVSGLTQHYTNPPSTMRTSVAIGETIIKANGYPFSRTLGLLENSSRYAGGKVAEKMWSKTLGQNKRYASYVPVVE